MPLPAIVATLWASKVARYAGIGLLSAAVLFGVRQHYINKGKEQGKEEAKSEVQEQAEQQRQKDREQYLALVEKQNQVIDEANARLAAADQERARQTAVIENLSRQRVVVAGQVQAVPDSGLRQFIVQSLALRQPGDPTPGYTIPEEREIALRVADYPLLKKQNAELTASIGTVDEKVDALNMKLDAMDAKYQALTLYTGRLEGYYVQLYNAFPHKHRHVKCLFLWKCANRKILTPNPQELQGGKPNG